MPGVKTLIKAGVFAKMVSDVVQEHVPAEKRQRFLRETLEALSTGGVSLFRDRDRVTDLAEPLTIHKSKHTDVFQVVLLDVLREPFEAWVKSRGLRTFPIPTSSEDELETLGVGPSREYWDGLAEAERG